MIHGRKAMLTTIMVHKNLLLWELDMGKNRRFGEMHMMMGSVTLQEITHLMSMHAYILVDSVGPPSAEVCRTAASFP